MNRVIKKTNSLVAKMPNDSEDVVVKLQGMGEIRISHTGSAVSIDVVDIFGESFAEHSKVLSEVDFAHRYYDRLQAKLEEFDPSVLLTPEFSDKAYKDGLLIHQAIEQWFEPGDFPIDTLRPMKGKCKTFHEQVKELTSPYIKISDSQFNDLLKGEADFYLTDGGKVVTFGGANEGYALMPLQDKFASKMLADTDFITTVLRNGVVNDDDQAKLALIGWDNVTGQQAWTTLQKTQDFMFKSACLQVAITLKLDFMTLETSFSLGVMQDGALLDVSVMVNDATPFDEQFERCLDSIRENESDNAFVDTLESNPDIEQECKDALHQLHKLFTTRQ